MIIPCFFSVELASISFQCSSPYLYVHIYILEVPRICIRGTSPKFSGPCSFGKNEKKRGGGGSKPIFCYFYSIVLHRAHIFFCLQCVIQYIMNIWKLNKHCCACTLFVIDNTPHYFRLTCYGFKFQISLAFILNVHNNDRHTTESSYSQCAMPIRG